MAARDGTGLPSPRTGAAPVELSFPDLPRLELDELLGQLVDRAHEVLRTQGRLRGLLRAAQLVTSELHSTTVLHRTVEAARDLLGARHADITLSEDAGGRRIESATARADGCPDAADVDRAAGGVAGTPRTFTGPPGTAPGCLHDLYVPVAVRGESIGILHVEDSDHGGFTSEDRELARALAATAGMAVQNARLYESARRRGEWLQASAAITRELLTGGQSGAGALELVARSSRDVAGADLVAVLRPDVEPGATELCVEVLVGPEEWGGRSVPVAGSLLGRVYTRGESVSVAAGDLDEESGAMPWTAAPLGPLLAAPLVGSAGVRGVLCAARFPGRPPFSTTDAQMAGSFAGQAAVAIELADARAEQQRALLLEERERIAADLQDHVVQRLFGVGLSLQGVLASLSDRRAAERVRASVDEVDRTIGHIRSTVFPLRTGPGARDLDPRGRVLDAVGSVVSALGFEPDLRFAGLLGGTVAGDVVEDLVAVVRAALLDVARRGRSSTAMVDVVEDRDGLVVHVRDDDPQGPDESGPVASELLRRAERHGGRSTVSAGTPGGTSQYWWVPRR
jgi:GAF domain-containing protein